MISVRGEGIFPASSGRCCSRLLPVAVSGRPSVGRRKLIDGIRRRLRTGAAWRDPPLERRPWTVYGLFRRRQRDGTWPMLLTGLQAWADAAGLIRWEVDVDSTKHGRPP
ncbi:transposase [Streptomyces sp. NPDC006208]|uniref:transposase n=1 Tax=Streptomyces sp. NPDC006208 TaxID=3156734 RepID=UPI0033BB2FAE